MPSRSKIAAMIQSSFHWFEQEVVGESHYQKTLRELAGPPRGQPLYYHSIANLYLEHENPYDPYAVRVDIHGQTVGYLPKEDAIRYRKEMYYRDLGYITLCCAAQIRGGWIDSETGAPWHYSVKLDMEDWDTDPWRPKPVPGREFNPMDLYKGQWPNDPG